MTASRSRSTRLCAGLDTNGHAILWEMPSLHGVPATLVMEPSEREHCRWIAPDVRCVSIKSGSSATSEWNLIDTEPQLSVPAPGPCQIVVTTHRVVWLRQVSDGEWFGGHARYEWVTRVQVDSDYRGSFLALIISLDGTPDEYLGLHLPVEEPDLNPLARWLAMVVLEGKEAIFENLGVVDNGVAETRAKWSAAGPDVGQFRFNCYPFPRHYVVREDGALAGRLGPPVGLGTVARLGEPHIHTAPVPLCQPPEEARRVRLPGCRFHCVAVLGDDDEPTGIYPATTATGDRIVREPADVGVEGQWIGQYLTIGYDQIVKPARLIVTASRVIVSIEHFEAHDRYSGGAGGAYTLWSQHKARQREVSKLLAGHARFPWISFIQGYRSRKGQQTLDITIDDGLTSPGTAGQVKIGVCLGAPKTPLCFDVARWLTTLVAQARMSAGYRGDQAATLTELAEQRFPAVEESDRGHQQLRISLPGSRPAGPDDAAKRIVSTYPDGPPLA